MAVPEDDMSVFRVRSTMNVEALLSVVSDVLSASTEPVNSLVV